ncbi:MAG: choice-of-anchor D domain-containing protein [Myxococcota bacterium]|nr:choice-of-anchor D domain-containing protein [Myxococcota bacterium]
MPRLIKLAAGLLPACFLLSLTGCDEGLRAEQTGTIQLSAPSFVIPKKVPGEMAEQSITVRNVGSGVLRLINFTGQFGSEFDLYWSRGDEAQQRRGIEDGRNYFPDAIDLAPEETMRLHLTYLARQPIVPRGRITVETNDRSNRNLAIPIEGAESGAELSVMPTAIDFGRVRAGDEAEEVLVATNFGQTTLIIDDMTINGSQDFKLSIGGVNPAENPIILQDPDQDGQPGLSPNRTIEITIRYAPPVSGPDDGELSITSNSIVPITNIPLTANGSSPCIQVVPDRIDFGAGLLGGLNPRPLTIESCGLEPLRIDALRLEAGHEAFSIADDTVPALPLRLPAATLSEEQQENPGHNLVVQFTPDEEIAYGGSLFIESNDPYTPVIEVPLNGRGSQNECPEARVTQEEYLVAPLDVITLDGSASTDADAPDGRPIRYEWTVIQRPTGSTAAPVESFTDPVRPQEGGPSDDSATPTAEFFVDIAGEYLIELTVTDRLGAMAPSDPCPQPGSRVRIVAEPLADIHVQLLWTTPRDSDDDDMGADVDLHLGHPARMGWFDALYDCYYVNPRPDWGIPNQFADDPSLDIDDIGGGGPENINLDNPESTQRLGGPYDVGAHYFRASMANFGGGDYGTSIATVRIYLAGELAYEGEKELRETNDFWEVGSIVWTDDEQRFLEIDRVFESSPFGQ